MHALGQASSNILAVQGDRTSHSPVELFEAAFAQTVGARHAVALDSPVIALRRALEVLDIQPGDEVITSPYNSRASAEVIMRLSARPVFVDVEAYSLNINSRLLEQAITGRTRAILAVHTAGLPSDIPTIQQIAARHGLPIIEDATYSFPSEYRGVPVGGMSPCTCFGLQGLAGIDGRSGQGGVLCTNNSEWAERSRRSQHRMSNDLAAADLQRFPDAESMWTRRSDIARQYNQAFVDMPELQIPADRFDSEHAWQLYMLRLNLERLSCGRGEFFVKLIDRGIDARVHFIPLHVHPFLRRSFGYLPEDFPVAYREHLREVSLPIRADMEQSEVDHVISAVRDIVAGSRRH